MEGMRRLFGIVFGLSLVGCTIDTGEIPPPPPAWGVPLTGGTMTVTHDGNRVVVADPDRDRVTIVDLTTERVIDTIELAAGSEPGRAIEDGAGRIHVAMRRSGQLLTITGSDRQLRWICGEPRGLAWQETTDLVHVACATGELVSLPAGGGDPTRVVRLERDLRDVLVRDTGLVVTTFRTAEMLKVDVDGTITGRLVSPTTNRLDFNSGMGQSAAVPSVAWRTTTLPDGRMIMAHQRRLGTVLKIITGGYSASCGGAAVESSLTIVGNDNIPFAVAPLMQASLPVDIAANPVSGDLSIVSAGQEAVLFVSKASMMTPDKGECGGVNATRFVGFQVGAPSSVAYRPNGALLIYYPEADGITILDGGPQRGISLGGRPGNDAGRSLFHRETNSGLACASCHPEARDDGGVWKFDFGARRTQNLGGGILSRAPYHWSADMPTLHKLVTDVFTDRMDGDSVAPEEERALGNWLDRVPAPRGIVVDTDAILRGEELFNSSETGCRSCHNGALYTNNAMANVSGGVFKVPSLIGVGGRAPYMHDGCAKTLRDRFGYCGGGDNHGHTSQLSATELSDLITYLESL